MSTVRLTDEQWSTILKFLRSCRKVYVGKESNCRRFVEGVLWITRSGAQWRLLPASYGNWNTIYKRFVLCGTSTDVPSAEGRRHRIARWCEAGVWEALHQACVQDPDLEAVMLDTTVVRAHACAAGASKKRRASRTSARA